MPDENGFFDIAKIERNLSVMNEIPPLHCMFFSAPKVGKTRLACTFPEPLLVDFEKGELTVEGKDIMCMSYVDVMDRVHIETFMDSLYTFLVDNPDRYKTIIFDTVTELLNIWLQQYAEDMYAEKPDKRDPLKNFQDDYGKATNWFRGQVRRFKNLKMHIVFNAHLREDEDIDKILRRRPDVTPSVGRFLMGQVSLIGYIYVEKNSQDRLMLIHPSHRVTAGARIRADLFEDEIPDELINPTFEDIAALIIPEWQDITKSETPRSTRRAKTKKKTAKKAVKKKATKKKVSKK